MQKILKKKKNNQTVNRYKILALKGIMKKFLGVDFGTSDLDLSSRLQIRAQCLKVHIPCN